MSRRDRDLPSHPNQPYNYTNWSRLPDWQITEEAIRRHMGVIDHGAIQGLLDDDHPQYLHLSYARTILARHTFNPSYPGSPFILGPNAQGQKVVGLNSDLFDGYDSTEFPRKAEDATITGYWTWANRLSMGGHKIENLADPTVGSDAANKAYVDDIASTKTTYSDIWDEMIVHGCEITDVEPNHVNVSPGIAYVAGRRVQINEQLVPMARVQPGWHALMFSLPYKSGENFVVDVKAIVAGDATYRERDGTFVPVNPERVFALVYFDSDGTKTGTTGYVGWDGPEEFRPKTGGALGGLTSGDLNGTGVPAPEQVYRDPYTAKLFAYTNGDDRSYRVVKYLADQTAFFPAGVTLNLGKPDHRWGSVYAARVETGTLTVTGGSTNLSNVYVTGLGGPPDGSPINILDPLVPWFNEQFDLGTSLQRWRTLYAKSADLSGGLTARGTVDIYSGSLTLKQGSETQRQFNIFTDDENNHYWHLVARSKLFGGSSEREDLILFFYDGSSYRRIFAVDHATGVLTFETTPTVGSNVVWHAGNDGSGSGLDADLLDGYDSLAFPRKEENATITGYWTWANRLSMGGNRIENLGDPAVGSDAATKAYVDNAAATKTTYSDLWDNMVVVGAKVREIENELIEVTSGYAYVNGRRVYVQPAILDPTTDPGVVGSGRVVVYLDAPQKVGENLLSYPKLAQEGTFNVTRLDNVLAIFTYWASTRNITDLITGAALNGVPFQGPGGGYYRDPHLAKLYAYVDASKEVREIKYYADNTAFWPAASGMNLGRSESWASRWGTIYGTTLNLTQDITARNGTFSGSLYAGGNLVWHSGNLNPNNYVRVDTTNLGKVGDVTLTPQWTTPQEWAALPVGFAQMVRNTVGIAGGAPVNNYGYFTKIANRDTLGGWAGLWIGYNDPSLWIGTTDTSNSFATWTKVWTEGNDGVGSGLDADKLDGLEGIAYARLGANQDIFGTWRVYGADPQPYSKASFRWYHAQAAPGQQEIHVNLEIGNTGGPNATSTFYFRQSHGDGTWADFLKYFLATKNVEINGNQIRLTGTSLSFNGYTVWHSGNDGGGSGLAADTLDGFHGSEYAKLGGDDTVSGLWTFSREGWDNLIIRDPRYTAKGHLAVDNNGFYLAANAYWTGSQWLRDDTSKPAGAINPMHLGTGRMEFRVADPGTGGFAWNYAMLIYPSGNVVVGSSGDSGRKLRVGGTSQFDGNLFLSVGTGLYFSGTDNHTDGLPTARIIEQWGMRFSSPKGTQWVMSTDSSLLVGYDPSGQTWGRGNVLVQGYLNIGFDSYQGKKLAINGDARIHGDFSNEYGHSFAAVWVSTVAPTSNDQARDGTLWVVV